MKKHWEGLVARINGGALRERILLFVVAVALLSLVWQRSVLQPMQLRQTHMAQSLEEINAVVTANISGRGADGAADEFSSLKARERALGRAIAVADEDLHRAQSGMIEPKQMVSVLTEVLQKQGRLKLVLLHNLPVQPLLPALPAGAGDQPAVAEAGPYVHPVELVVSGEYLSVLAYLKELESRPWGFQWRRFDFSSHEEGPEYRIEFTTLSMQSNWLGV